MLVLALGLGLFTAVAMLAGALVALAHRHPSRRFLTLSIGFGGGFLLGAALLEMLPEAIGRGGAHTAALAALGYLLLYFGEHLFRAHFHHVPAGAEAVEGADPHFLPPGTAWTTLMAFSLHDFMDGLGMGAGFSSGLELGVLVFLAVLLHKVPAGFAIASVARGAGYGRRSAALATGVIGALTVTGVAVAFLLGEVSAFLQEVFLGVAAGSFLYLGATILVPTTETGGVRGGFLSVAGGVGAFYLVSLLARLASQG